MDAGMRSEYLWKIETAFEFEAAQYVMNNFSDRLTHFIEIYSYTSSNEVISTIQVMGALNVNRSKSRCSTSVALF